MVKSYYEKLEPLLSPLNFVVTVISTFSSTKKTLGRVKSKKICSKPF